MDVYTELKRFLINDLTQFEVPQEQKQYVERIIEYNVPHGKLNRGLAVVDTLLAIKEGRVTNKELHDAAVLGWCIEWLQAMFLVADDLMDDSVTRRGQPCWYRLDDVGLIACNDYLILETQLYRILRQYFRNVPQYQKYVDLFWQTQYQTEIGQLFDLRTQPPQDTKAGKVDLNRYTQETYNRIVKYKTAYYSFYLPIALGLLISGIEDPKIYAVTEEICVKMGVFFQIQDDYLDCYGDEKTIGKIGRDIEDAKCGWLVVQALQVANQDQRKILEESYGKDDPMHVQRVKKLYQELNLAKKYQDYEDRTEKELRYAIAKVKGVNTTIYTALLNKIAKRQK